MSLLHLCDSLFPIGSFGYSDGLESAVVRLKPDATTKPDAATAAQQLADWIDTGLDETIGRLEGPTVCRAWRAFEDSDWEALATIDAESIALRPSSSARKSSRAMGCRLLTTWSALHPEPRLQQALRLAQQGNIGPALPVAFAGACATSAIDQRAAIEAFAYTRLAATISAAMRLMPIGQTDAHLLLARALERVPAVADAIIARAADAESFAPHVDVALMQHQYLHSRLFRT
jgi:urease accessory protein